MTLRTQIGLVTASLMLAALGSQAMALEERAPHHRGGHHGLGGFGMLLRAADTNQDHAISWAEIDSLQREEFTFRDRNNDGVLSLEDRGPMAQRIHALREEHRAAREENADEGHEGRGRHRAHRMAVIDTNGDQRISYDEFSAHHRAKFDEWDTSHDGVVSQDEFDAAREAYRAERRERRGDRQRRHGRQRD
ncbi:EF-hand domain-containing protein [Woodsholea maritima]|uniref:hypothetical protein n=1 Tax=Woodsholea maritima TaxID=240237 RepID=UPI00037DD7DA|nr:hypothetical protein [Woodsholea maritima]